MTSCRPFSAKFILRRSEGPTQLIATFLGGPVFLKSSLSRVSLEKQPGLPPASHSPNPRTSSSNAFRTRCQPIQNGSYAHKIQLQRARCFPRQQFEQRHFAIYRTFLG